MPLDNLKMGGEISRMIITTRMLATEVEEIETEVETVVEMEVEEETEEETEEEIETVEIVVTDMVHLLMIIIQAIEDITNKTNINKITIILLNSMTTNTSNLLLNQDTLTTIYRLKLLTLIQ